MNNKFDKLSSALTLHVRSFLTTSEDVFFSSTSKRACAARADDENSRSRLTLAKRKSIEECLGHVVRGERDAMQTLGKKTYDCSFKPDL